ncbi:MAG: transglycosylase domain-containing protein [Congregibacter sp.]
MWKNRHWIYSAIVFAVLLLAGLYFALLGALPSAQEIVEQRPPATSLLLDRHGELLYRFYANQDRIPIELEAVPRHLIQAVLAIEDRKFYQHRGFSLSGMARALRNNYRRGRTVEGGSTITQQLVKNRVIGSERTFTRKFRELVLAIKLELLLTKNQILELYLNQIAWGGTSYGIEAATLSYFGKSAAQLTLSESAFLAGLLKAPSNYSPFRRGNTSYLFRKRLVLNRMLDEGFITEEQRFEALNERLGFASQRVSIKAPHFSLYVKRLLKEKLGEHLLETGGLRIRSSLNLALHEDVQRLLSTQVRELFRHWVSNGAALITNPRNGEILSMVGSVDYFDAENHGAVNTTLSLRQPGSSIKPLTYAMALAGGKTARSLLSDKQIELEIPDEGSYVPRNIDYSFRGDLTLRQALAASRNVPAVNELVEIGVSTYVAKAETLGIHSWGEQNEFRFALTLGSGEVRMIDMAQMFSAFPNLGTAVAPNPLLSITDRDGDTIYTRDCAKTSADCHTQQAFSPGVAFLINSILSDNEARAPTFGRESNLRVPRHEVAVKTGTTDLLRDNWAIGYTSDRLAAVWIGNNDGSPMRFIHSGELGASKIWNSIMQRLLATRPSHRFPIPADIVSRPVCSSVSRTGCDACDETVWEFFVVGTETSHTCNDEEELTTAIDGENRS